MSRVEGALELAISADEAQACCRRGIADLGWTVIRDQPGLLEAREDFTRLACCQSPAEARLETRAQKSAVGFG